MYCVTLRLHDIKKLQSPLNKPWKYFTFLVKALLPSFHYSLGIYIYFFIHFIKSKLVLVFPLQGIYLLLCPIYFELYDPFFTNWISISNFAYIATAESRVSAENKGIKVSVLSHIWPRFTAIVLPVLWQIYEISSCYSHSLRGIITQ